MTNTKDVEIMKDNTPLKKEMDDAVEEIVTRWNTLVKNFQNTTIQLCMMVQDKLKAYPTESVKEILHRVKQHPNIKRFVSIDRIWQGMRLIKDRPDLIQYQYMDLKDKEAVENKPYIKKDGEIFWEFYFELEKQPFSSAVKSAIEYQAKEEQWSFRQLRQHIQDTKDEMEHPMGSVSRKNAKYELIRDIHKILKEMEVDRLRGVLNFCKEFSQPNFGIDEKELKKQG